MCIQITIRIFSQTSVKLTQVTGFLNNQEVQLYFFPLNFDYILYLKRFQLFALNSGKANIVQCFKGGFARKNGLLLYIA